jgi:hypothetical protein
MVCSWLISFRMATSGAIDFLCSIKWEIITRSNFSRSKAAFSGGRNNDQDNEIESRVFHQMEFFSHFSGDQKFLKHYVDFRSPENIVSLIKRSKVF